MVVAAFPARADIELPSVPPPQPKAVTVNVYRGESVEIPLEGLSRSGFQLRFLIRKNPELGTLSEPVATGRTTATIVYTHDDAAGLGEDRFRYAVQTSNTGVSTPAEVTVRVIERPPLFAAPSKLDFPMTAVGEVSHRELEIRNAGGGHISGETKVAEPWKIVTGGGRYDLGPGDTHSIIVVFDPSQDRDYSGSIEFSHAEGASVALFGRGYEPISVVPRELRLESDGRSEVRGTTFIIRNRSDVDHELRIEAPEGVLVDERVNVPAKSEVDVAMHTSTGFLQPLNGFLQITGERIDLSVPVHVEPAPVRLAVDREAIDFGELGSGRTGRQKLIIRNTGGTPADLRVSLPEGGDIRPLPSAELLGPGDSREFEVSFARLAAGDVDAVLTVEASASRIEVPVRAKIAATVGGTKEGTSQPAMPKIDLADIPPVPQISVVAKNEREVDVSWKKTAPDVARYTIFLRRIEKNAKGQAVFRYVPLEQAKVRIVRDEARATIQGFRPGEQITVQIVGYDVMGRPSPASPPFTIWSKPATPVRIPWTLLGFAGLVVAAVIVFRERRRRRLSMEIWTP